MPVLPTGIEPQIEFFEARIANWSTNAAAIGLTPAQMLSFSPLISAARSSFTAAQTARAASKSATVSMRNAHATMISPGRDYISTIKAYALTTNNPNVYAIAQIDPPSPPTPVPAPATPTDLRGSIDASGILTIAWDAIQSGPSSGIIFLVSRKNPGTTEFAFIGATFEKQFIDPGFAACDGDFAYRIQAQRGDLASGFAGPLLINLGGGGGIAGIIGGEGSAAVAA